MPDLTKDRDCPFSRSPGWRELVGRVRRCAGFDLFLAEPVSPVPNQILSVFDQAAAGPSDRREITVEARQEFERHEKRLRETSRKKSRKSPAATAGLFYYRSIRSRTN
jgi:hypothetical protein